MADRTAMNLYLTCAKLMSLKTHEDLIAAGTQLIVMVIELARLGDGAKAVQIVEYIQPTLSIILLER